MQKLAVGTIPQAMWVVLEDDLVDSCKAGDDVTICGVVMRRWRPIVVEVGIIYAFNHQFVKTNCTLFISIHFALKHHRKIDKTP